MATACVPVAVLAVSLRTIHVGRLQPQPCARAMGSLRMEERSLLVSNKQATTGARATSRLVIWSLRSAGSNAGQVASVAAEIDVEADDEADGYFLELVNDIVSAGTWDLVQGKVDALIKEGKMNERVLDAGLMLLGECRARGLPENVTATMESVCELLTRAVEETQMTPTMRLMRQLSEFNPKVAEIEQMMEQAFSRDVALDDFREDLEFFLKAMDDEEVDLPEAVDAAAAKEQMAQLADMRKDARERMSALLEIASTSAKVAKAAEAALGKAPSSGGGA